MSYFPEIKAIQYEGAKSKNPYAFKFYNPEEAFEGTTMQDYLRFGVAYWHTFTEDLSDPFGAGTAIRPWDTYSGIDLAKLGLKQRLSFLRSLMSPIFVFMMSILHLKERRLPKAIRISM